MSLNWSAKNVANWEKVNTDENWPWIEAVIFGTMSVGISELKESNVKEFRRRLLMARAAMGYSFQELKEFSETVTEEFLTSLIGLGTNASTKTITQFNKDLIANMESRIYTLTR